VQPTRGRLAGVVPEEALDWRGKSLADVEVAELIDMLHEAREALA